MEDLHTEIHRITNCPYTPSLKKLHDILQNVDTGLLQLWARGNPCQIDAIAVIVLEALELWPFTLDVLKIMASIPSFRNAAVQQKPMLLETLFTNATDSKSGFEKYTAVCVALLSTPLECATPSEVPVFLLKCLEKAVQSLSPETIRPVYLLLSGVESSYLDILPFDILSSLQSQMIEVLTQIDSDDHLASLLCLAVLAKFASRPGIMEQSQPNVQSFPKDENGPESADRFLPARKFFSSKKAPKTLDLVVLKVITACSQSCQLGTDEIVESLKLSREIVDAFDKKEICFWQAGNVGKTKKLYAKILRPGIEAKVQCEALNFLVALSAGDLLLPEVIPSLKSYLLTSKADVLSTNAIEQCIVLLEDVSICELLDSLLALACAKLHPCRESLTKIDHALRLITIFMERIPTSSKLLKTVLQFISSKVVSDMLRQYAFQAQGPLRSGFVHCHSTIDVCPLLYREAQVRLHHSLVLMFLESALYASECGCHFDASMMTLLLGKTYLQSPAQPASTECTQRRPTNLIKPRVSLFEAVSTPRVDSVSLNWRDGLIRELSRDVDCRYEGVIRIIGEICRDLELRCNETELPLREEQSRSRDLQARMESSERNKAELEFQAQNHQSALNALEIERDRLANQIEATERRLKELGTSLDNIHQEFDHAKIEAERAAQAAIESARQQDLAYLATMTRKDEILEEQCLKLATAENHVKNLEHELDRVRGLEANKAERLNDSEAHIETLNSAISASECLVKDLQNELVQTKGRDASNTAKISNNETLIQELNSTIGAVNEASDQNRSLISTLKDQIREAEIERSEMQSQHQTFVSAKDAEIERLNESNRSSNDKWQSELEAARSRAAAANEQSAATIAGLHNKVRKLRKEREERAREFAKAQELSGRLMSLMGTNKHQTSSHGAQSRTPGHSERDLPSSDANSSDLPAAKSYTPSASSRAPKRIKRHLDSRTPTTCATKSLNPMTTSKEYRRSTMRVGRVPLADLGSMQGPGSLTPQNPRHQEHHTPKTEGAGEVPTQNDQAHHRFDSDAESFGGGDIFTSTDQQQLSAFHCKLPRHDYDETTTEF
ncbi:MAG: hypothetical protein ALECFALPRED_003021 [Alectoria fallacina]|uniref:Uncharacterized protein n=1 Tax=Alectoria fallacina TaxID=1903189 RepID=A0A8H3EET1_9LECA|nr:MAG: hypothetical protein ALECFALPRED_003021 [Alectoria fallacina]